jgi:hypothetical protein
MGNEEDYSIFDGLSVLDQERMTKSIERYNAALHAVQSGVALEISRTKEGTGAASPKHLRVGVNSAMIQNGALVRLMVDKGVITWPEWFERLALEAEREQKAYEDRNEVKFA